METWMSLNIHFIVKIWCSDRVFHVTVANAILKVWNIFWNSSICICATTTDIHHRSQTSYTTPCNGVVSHGAQFGGLWVFANHILKINAKQMCSRSSCCAAFAFVFKLRLWYMQVTYPPNQPQLFWLREDSKTPKFSPIPESRWHRFWDLWCISVATTYASNQ